MSTAVLGLVRDDASRSGSLKETDRTADVVGAIRLDVDRPNTACQASDRSGTVSVRFGQWVGFMARKMNDQQRRTLAEHLDGALSARHWTKTKLAERAGFDERTIRNVLDGHSAKYETYDAICTALGLNIEDLIAKTATAHHPPAGLAPAALGGYSRVMCDHYVGDYITVRPKFADPSVIKAYRTRISWNEAISCLSFAEFERDEPDHAQNGTLYITPNSACIYLVTIEKGWVRTIIATKKVAAAKEMRGLITSQFNVVGASFAPVCAPIAYIRLDDAAAQPSYGELSSGDCNYENYLRILQETIQQSFVRVVLPPMPDWTRFPRAAE